ncbi:hypothetical protein TUZN_0277 [Thermoproteus uzoniensis 768-20]|uniref:DUF1641 domain-containing protein n=1 Tax=Thermoproteus uzoniensis (strain 768-20) TaxID=999630 RepID=F2L2B0_THEU7|nr:DUF1641 domain-containing protein [Thermoproteus uzoniensis]AEA11775.1 hypothetical protein TUZN_0277 [Thermoproteus uzoniensis 768-20]
MSSEERIFKALADPQKQEALAVLLENIDAVKDLVVFLSELRNSGVFELLAAGIAAAKALSADLITSRDFAEKFAKFAELASAASAAASNTEGIACISKAVSGANASRPVGIYGLLQALQDPDVQRGLGYIVSIVKVLGSCLASRQQ